MRYAIRKSLIPYRSSTLKKGAPVVFKTPQLIGNKHVWIVTLIYVHVI